MCDALWRLVFIKHLCKFCSRLTHLFRDKYIQNFLTLFPTSEKQEQYSTRANMSQTLFLTNYLSFCGGFFLASAVRWNIYRAISQGILVQTWELFSHKTSFLKSVSLYFVIQHPNSAEMFIMRWTYIQKRITSADSVFQSNQICGIHGIYLFGYMAVNGEIIFIQPSSWSPNSTYLHLDFYLLQSS